MSTYIEIPDSGGSGASVAADVAVTLSPSNYTVGVSGANVEGHLEGIDTQLGLKADLVGGVVPASQLPSYVDDVEEYANLASFPVTGETGKIYVALDTNRTYRWTGSVYVEVSSSPVDSVNGQTGVVSLDTDDVAEGATNKYYSDTLVDANTNVTGSVTAHSDVTDAGSGAIITGAERTLVSSATQPGDNISTLTNDSGFITTSDIWERALTTISPINAGDDLDLEDGDLLNVTFIEGSTTTSLDINSNLPTGALSLNSKGDIRFNFDEDNDGNNTVRFIPNGQSSGNYVLQIAETGNVDCKGFIQVADTFSFNGTASSKFFFNNTNADLFLANDAGTSRDVKLRATRRIIFLADSNNDDSNGDEFIFNIDNNSEAAGTRVADLGANGLHLQTGNLTLDNAIELVPTSTAISASTAGESVVLVTDTSAARTITLATADVVAGRIVIIKDASGGAATNNITVATQGAETIDGAATVTISANYGALRVVSDGTNWFAI